MQRGDERSAVRQLRFVAQWLPRGQDPRALLEEPLGPLGEHLAHPGPDQGIALSRDERIGVVVCVAVDAVDDRPRLIANRLEYQDELARMLEDGIQVGIALGERLFVLRLQLHARCFKLAV
jgi:hypothetical protein